MGDVTRCGICGSASLTPVLDMGDQPLAEAMDSHARYPLRLLECGNCTLVQLGHVVPQATVFAPGHPYATGNTRALRDHFAALARDLTARYLPAGSLTVDVGANDGTLLHAYPPAVRKVAVEPTAQALNIKGAAVYGEFFTTGLATRIRAEHGPAQVVTACNVLAHVPDPHDFAEGAAVMLADDGVFVTENHDLRSVTGGLQIDTVYHEHLRYYSVTSLSRLLAMHGLQCVSAVPVATHGGSVRVTAARPRGGLQRRAEAAGESLRSLVAALHAGGADIYGIGAATRATPLIHYARIAPYLACVCEVAASAKIGHRMPGTDIPVVDEARLIEEQPGYALLLAWHVKDTLIPRLRTLGYRGRFIQPLPEAVILDA